MSKLNKLFACTSSLLLTVSFANSSYAAEGTDTITERNLHEYKVVNGEELVKDVNLEGKKMNEKEIYEKYNLKDATNIPKGSTVVKFDKEEDLQKFLIKINKQHDEAPEITVDADSGQPVDDNSEAPEEDHHKRQKRGGGTVQKRTFSLRNFGEWVHLWADIDWNKKKKITSCRVWTTHTGLTIGSDWEEKKTGCDYISERSRLIWARGVRSWVIVFKGIGKIASWDKYFKFKYTVR